MAGAQEFAARPVTPKDARALYGLRCALAHEYSLKSTKSSVRHLFALRQDGLLVEHPVVDWARVSDPNDATKTIWPTERPENQTKINLLEVGAFVEELVTNVRAEHAAGRVALAPGATAFDLRNRSQFVIV